ncbi:MAG: acyl carrier protein [Nitrosopumilaceae archaeon]
MSEKLYSIISHVMNIPVSEINDQSSPETIENWDSFSGYILLDEIESEFNVKFTLDETLEIKNVGDFKKLLQKQGIAL